MISPVGNMQLSEATLRNPANSQTIISVSVILTDEAGRAWELPVSYFNRDLKPYNKQLGLSFTAWSNALDKISKENIRHRVSVPRNLEYTPWVRSEFAQECYFRGETPEEAWQTFNSVWHPTSPGPGL